MTEKIYIFDTTLRDGEQSAGVAFTPEEKLELAKQVERLGVDIIEAGFPCASPGDLEAVKRIAREVRGTTICALARAVKADIEKAWEGVSQAADPAIHVFINTSQIQMAHQLRKDPKEVLEQACEMVRYARSFTEKVEFSPMDATRSDRDFLYRIIEQCIAAGASVINIPDSVGYAIPEEFGAFVQDILEHVPNADRARFSVHAHNDLGLSTSNALAALQHGARQVEVSINGIGERAGNTPLEEVVMAIKTRPDFLGFHTDIRTRELYRTSKLVESRSGMPVQWNKAIVGRNAFRHSSGIHQDGILKKRETWEIMNPEEIGIPQGTQLVMGKLTGRHAFRNKVVEMGYELSDEQLSQVFATFKELADKKELVDDRDLEAILIDQLCDVENPAWTLDHIHVSSGNHATATATLRLMDQHGHAHEDAATGTGPVDAVYRAMNRITSIKPLLTEFSIKSVTEGIDAQGEVTIRIEEEGRTFTGRGSHTDIIVASARAYTNALNLLIASRELQATTASTEEGP